jgi:hypothetical protein
MKITLRNDLHGSEAVVIAKDGIVSPESIRRAIRKLCGISDCRCGGIHGHQDFEYTYLDHKKMLITGRNERKEYLPWSG